MTYETEWISVARGLLISVLAKSSLLHLIIRKKMLSCDSFLSFLGSNNYCESVFDVKLSFKVLGLSFPFTLDQVLH